MTTPTRHASVRRPTSLLRRAAITCALAAVGAGLAAGAATASASATATPASGTPGYAYETVDNAADPTFNQLLGINDHGLVVGYFGSGAPGHPNKGYQLARPYLQHDFRTMNFPGSAQTQVVAVNRHGTTAGFWVDAAGDNFGFVQWDGQYLSVSNPHSHATPRFDQLLGINDHDVAVGFWVDAAGNSHGYTFDVHNRHFDNVVVPGSTSTTATSINDEGWVSGFAVIHGRTVGFVKHGHHVDLIRVAHGSNVQVLGINNADEIVGSYEDSAAVTHGFLETPHHRLMTIDAPNAAGSTVINGLNDRGRMVGFYTDAAGNTDGLVVFRN